MAYTKTLAHAVCYLYLRIRSSQHHLAFFSHPVSTLCSHNNMINSRILAMALLLSALVCVSAEITADVAASKDSFVSTRRTVSYLNSERQVAYFATLN
jgi:hypothetical protein